MLEPKKVARYSVVITIILVVSKMTGFLREFIVAISFGATKESDIFKIASTMPQVLFSFVAAGLTTSFIPTFSDLKNDRDKANKFFNNMLNIIIIFCIGISILGIIFSPLLVKGFAGGFDSESTKRTIYMTRILMPSIIFLAMSGLYTGYLQSYAIFIQPALTGIVANIVIIAGILIFYKYGIIAAIVSIFLSALAQAFMQRPFMKGYQYKFYVNLKDEYVIRMLLLSIPVVISCIVAQINLMVARNFASHLVEGSISVIDYATKISTIINQVFIVSITTVVYPSLTEKYSNNDEKGFNYMFKKSVNMVSIIAIPLIFGVMVLSTPLVKLLLEHGNFDRIATMNTSSCLKYLVFSALGYSFIDILGKVFFASKDTLTPMINGFILIGLNILFIFLLGPKLGVKGIALATTFSTIISALIMFVELKFKFKSADFRNMIISFVKILISGIVMAIIVNKSYMLINNLLIKNSVLYLSIKIILTTIIGALIYTFMLIILKVDELESIVNIKFKKTHKI